MSKNLYTNVAVFGNKILFRGVIDGKRRNVRYDYKPTLYVSSNEESQYKTIHGDNISPIEFDTIREAKDFISRYEDVDGFRIYGHTRWEYPFIDKKFHDHVDWDISDINVTPIDIEVESETGYGSIDDPWQPINAIAMVLSGQKYSLGMPRPESRNKITSVGEDVIYYEFNDEISLLKKFLELWSRDYPDVITGWNVKFFDMPYLINRMIRVLGEETTKKISPWKHFYKRVVNTKMGTQLAYVIYGISTLDYQELYKKYDKNGKSQDDYTLDNIAEVVLGKKKVDYSEYDNLSELYIADYEKYIVYNIEDMNLISEMEDKIGLISLALTLAYDAKVNFDDVFSQVRMWTVMIHNKLREENIIAPYKKEEGSIMEYEGAFVKPPTPGRYLAIVAYDLRSLYPHLIMQYNISPEMLVEPEDYTPAMRKILEQGISIEKLLNREIDTSGLDGTKYTLTPNGQFFRTNEQGFLNQMMEEMFNQRDAYKKEMKRAKNDKEGESDKAKILIIEKRIAKFSNLQETKKICLNSAYGALGNVYFFLYDTRQAEAITSSGQLAIRWVSVDVNNYLNKILQTSGVDYIIASDTDSMFLNLELLAEKAFQKPVREIPTKDLIDFLEKVGDTKIKPIIVNSYNNLAKYLNVFKQKMEMNRAEIADVGIWTAKKRYALNVHVYEDVHYQTPDIKITGLEAIKSTTPKACRPKIKEAIKLMLTGTEDQVIELIDKFRKEFPGLPLREIASSKSCNGLNKWNLGDKKLPAHVRAGLHFNKLLKELKLDTKYSLINDGAKVKLLPLKEPNKLHSDSIAFLRNFPKEFELDQFIDYDTQFYKAFLKPVEAILDVIGWRSEEPSDFTGLWT